LHRRSADTCERQVPGFPRGRATAADVTGRPLVTHPDRRPIQARAIARFRSPASGHGPMRTLQSGKHPRRRPLPNRAAERRSRTGRDNETQPIPSPDADSAAGTPPAARTRRPVGPRRAPRGPRSPHPESGPRREDRRTPSLHLVGDSTASSMRPANRSAPTWRRPRLNLICGASEHRSPGRSPPRRWPGPRAVRPASAWIATNVHHAVLPAPTMAGRSIEYDPLGSHSAARRLTVITSHDPVHRVGGSHAVRRRPVS